MKKGLKITGIVLAVLLILLISIPYFFSGKIESIVKKEANEMLNAEFDFNSLSISLIRNFPKASITLKDFFVKGQDKFVNDTLIQGKELTATVDLFSLFKSDGYTVDKIILDQSKVNAIILADGKVNWDIMKEDDDSDKKEEEDTDDDSSFALEIKKVEVNKFNLIFNDQEGKQYAQLDDMNLTLSGDLSSTKTQLDINTQIGNLLYASEGSTLLNNVTLKGKINLDADLENNKFTLNKNEIWLNAIKASLDGWVQLKEDDAIDMDLKLNTDKVQFKEILSLIPAVFMDDDFKKVKTDGEVDLSAFAQGTYRGEQLPKFDLTLNVKDATFRYPSLPAGVDKINIHANISNPGGSADRTTIVVNPFSLVLAGNPFSIKANVATPISDPRFNVEMKGILNLGKIKDVYPLEDMNLKGIVDANLSVAGQMSFIEKELYDKIKAAGTVKLNDMEVEMKDMPNVQIQKSLMTFTSQYLKLDDTTILIGKNDLTINSQLSNYMGYAMKGSTINGSLNIKSNHFNVNDLMGADDATEAQEEETASGLIEIPKNINFNMNADFKELIYDNITLNNLNGKIVVNNGKADMSNLSFKTFDGDVKMNGYYSTTDVKHPAVKANLNFTNLSFAKTYDGMNIVRKLAPIFGHLGGTYSGALNIQTEIDNNMDPVYATLQSTGNLSTNNINIKDVEMLQGLGKALKQEDLFNRPMKDMNIAFEVKDGRLHTKPFNFNVGNYDMTLSGTTGLDQTIDYSGKVKLPANVTKIDGFDTVGILIGGTFGAPTFKVDTKSMLDQGSKVLQDKAKDMIQKELFKNKKDSTDTEKNLETEVKENVGNAINNLFKKKKK